jgi:hypothetical protein
MKNHFGLVALVAVMALASGCAVTETSSSTTVLRVPAGQAVAQPGLSAPVAPQPGPAAIVGQGGLSIGDVVAQINAKRPDTDIVMNIRQQGVRAPLNAADIDLLLANGATREVIDALLQAQMVVSGPVVTAPATTSTTTVIQAVPPPVVVPRVSYGWGWPYGAGWGGSVGFGRSWGWWGPPRVVHPPVVVGPPVVVAPPVHVRPPVVVAPGGGFGAFGSPHSGWRGPSVGGGHVVPPAGGNFGRFNNGGGHSGGSIGGMMRGPSGRISKN